MYVYAYTHTHHTMSDRIIRGEGGREAGEKGCRLRNRHRGRGAGERDLPLAAQTLAIFGQHPLFVQLPTAWGHSTRSAAEVPAELRLRAGGLVGAPCP